jgi:inner membrane protein involved in colicin E2 resistance
MVKRLLAIAFIFVSTSLAWLVLGGTIMARTSSSGDRLRGRVQSVWGTPQVQAAPFAEYSLPVRYAETITENGKQRIEERTRLDTHTIRPSTSDANVDLQVEPRRKGLLWYSTYKVNFRGDYEFRNPEQVKQTVRLYLQFPAAQAVYDDLQFLVNGQPATPVTEKEKAYVQADLLPDQSVKLQVTYRSQGLDSWKYSFGQSVNPVQNFHLRMTTNFKEIDFPDNTLAPGEKRELPDGWQLDWNYKNLLSGYEIAMTMPEKLQPGPLASEISFFAPVSLFFFFFLIFIITTLRNIDLHPMNYFFLAGAFFAFHLLLAYLADHVDIHISFAICSAVSVFLVVTYLRLVTGIQFAIREAALAQVIYLVLFSYAFFFKGLTGLSITIGAVLTLFVVMQMTGRIRWSEKFEGFDPRRAAAPPPLGNLRT